MTGADHSKGYELWVVSGDALESFALPREGTVTLGRAEDNAIRIDHPSVSRRHARLTLGARVLIEDLGGSNGTFVRDTSVRDAAVSETGEGKSHGETQRLRRLGKRGAELGIGEQVLIGAVSVVLRAPTAAAPEPALCSENMREIHEQAARAAQAAISVLVLGETGVGKEVLARAIHAGSARAKLPFLGINCAALGEGMLEGELFGYERGAFTGAVLARAGLFEAADGGTVFLDEIGDLPKLTQAKLLRVLEDRSVLRLGARSARAIDIRVIAATNRDLEQDVRDGRFRQDLFYRLNAITLSIPPLRERASEIEGLAHSFVAAACGQLKRPALEVSSEVLQSLLAHSWPGNVRELKNAMERAVVLCSGSEIRLEHLPHSWRSQATLSGPASAQPAPAHSAPPPPTAAPAPAPLAAEAFRAQVDSIERARIVDALSRCSGNQTRAAQLLGMSRRTLVNRLGQLGLPRPKQRRGSDGA